MQLHTVVPVQNLSSALNYQSKIMSLGSCFAEHICEKLAFHGFSTFTNPFGIIFNAVSIQRLVERSVNLEWFTADDVFLNNELWQSYEVHSALSTTDSEAYLAQLNAHLKVTREFLENATHCILTLGTSWVYTHQGKVVANCHKVPNSQFEKKLLSAEENQKALQKIRDCIQQINPNIQFIFTVSPVRHIKDGYLENHLSKGNLLQAIYNLQQNPNSYYFPAFEIVMDELRDYRFFASDMIHPNSLAIDYIWERFTAKAIDNACEPIMKEVAVIKRALHHRPQHQNTLAWAQFQNQLEQKIAAFQKKYPAIHLYSRFDNND